MKLTEAKTIGELEKKFYQRNVSWPEFAANALLFIARRVNILKTGELKRKPRKLNKWSIFLGKQIKNGKTFKEAAELWKIKKNSK